MTATPRVRFAPSPTGQVHIGNIRVAIFNALFARHEGGHFLLRVEDTDLERSTPEAVEALMEVMDWLELGADEEPLFQSRRREAHLAAAEQLIQGGHAYRHARSAEEAPATFFRVQPIPDTEHSGTRSVGEQQLALMADHPLRVDFSGIQWVGVSRKGKADPAACCLEGMADLKVLDAEGAVLFSLAENLDAVKSGELEFESEAGASLQFTRREIWFKDGVKGELAKSLDAMKDLVIVRGDGSPVFHLANVLDDIEQRVSHVIRGDDHVENSYRHLALYAALGESAPVYAHLPMIVNEQGKPYSKRDGDAFVGDFRAKGYLAEALFNYLALLGWSPGDDREKLNRDELIEAFSLEQVQQSPAQMDFRKLNHLNGQYLQDLPQDLYLADVRDLLSRQPWAEGCSLDTWTSFALLMRPRLQRYAEVLDWSWLAQADFERNEKALKRGLGKAWQRNAAEALLEKLEAGSSLSEAREAVCAEQELDPNKLMLPVRVGLTGQPGGPDLEELLGMMDSGSFAERLRISLAAL